VPIIGWLLLRCLILAGASRESTGSVRTWTLLSAGMDFLLAALLAAGLSISTIVISLFGPTPELVASFAWVLAASFVVNGLMLLEVASCHQETTAQS
jgi:phosphopantothenoylcysteine synthetase/decarboxylase